MEAVTQTPTAGAIAESRIPSGAPARGPFHETRLGWLVLGLVWTGSAAYLAACLRQGWAPPDAGALGQMAERVLHGQVPFRDFDEIYTGGLTYLNALSFRLFGTNLFSLRIPLYLFFLGWVPSVYWVARRFAAPLTAGAVTLLAIVWSVPNYPEAMPSWYNLFFATWGVLALFRYTESEEKKWLWIAGMCGGLSFLVKLSGLYFVAACLLFFVFREQSFGQPAETGSQRALPYRLFVTAGLLLFLASLVSLISGIPSIAGYLEFVLPSACFVAGLLWTLWQTKSCASGRRFRRLMGMGLRFLGGFLVPVSIFLLWFVEKRALTAWFKGTFISPTVRLQWAGGPPTPLGIVAGLLPAVLIVLLAYDSRASSRRAIRFAGPVVLAGILLAAWKWPSVYLLVGFSLPLLVPILALVALVRLRPSAEPRRQEVFLAVAAAALCALVQFPASAAIYFNQVAPLVILGLLAVLPHRPNYDRIALGSVLAFYLLFALWLHTPGFLFETRVLPGQPVSYVRLDLPRAGGIHVKPNEAREYESLVRLVRAHAVGSYIYAGPDAPEVYFLTGLRNPTRTIIDFLDSDFSDVPSRNQRILSTIHTRGVNLAVLRIRRVQSAPIAAALKRAFDTEFPQSDRVGDFEVRWK